MSLDGGGGHTSLSPSQYESVLQYGTAPHATARCRTVPYVTQRDVGQHRMQQRDVGHHTPYATT